MSEGFEAFKLNKQLLNAIHEKGYRTPTEIQEKIIPIALSGHDVLGIAPTGTGKTAAYALPILMKIKYAQGDAPRCIVLCPSRELVGQVLEVMNSYSTYLDLRVVGIYGGGGKMAQLKALEGGVDVLIATPGRLLEFYKDRVFDVRTLNTLVLDEADKMMDMGFMPQLRRVLEIIPVKRQNMLFSATFPEKVEQLSTEFLEFPTKIEVKQETKVAETIDHYYYQVPNIKTKINLLQNVIANIDFEKILIFVKTKQTANDIYKFIERKLDVPVKVIHGNKEQNTRLNAINSFREGDTRVLVATDVVARGIDVSNVSYVINFDVPLVYEDYIHRVGRTGRAEKKGEAMTFVSPAEVYHLRKIEKIVGKPIDQKSFSEELVSEEMSFEEKQSMNREIDFQRRKEDPNYKGAFHEKKRKSTKQKPTQAKRRKR